MRSIRVLFTAALLAGAAALSSCDFFVDHGHVDVTNGTGLALIDIVVSDDFETHHSGPVAIGGHYFFSGIAVGSVTIIALDSPNHQVGGTGGTVVKDGTLNLTVTHNVGGLR